MLPLVSVNIPDEEAETALRILGYTQHAAREQREAAAGIPTTNHRSENPDANPLSDSEWHLENVTSGLLADQGWVISHNFSDRYHAPSVKPPHKVRESYDARRPGTTCLQALRLGVRLGFEEYYRPVIGANLAEVRYIGNFLAGLLKVEERKAARIARIENSTAEYLSSIMTIQVVTPEEAAQIRDIRTYEEQRRLEDIADLEQAQREADWREERERLRRQGINDRLANPRYVAMLREIVAAKRRTSPRLGQTLKRL